MNTEAITELLTIWSLRYFLRYESIPINWWCIFVWY